jgi:Uma2 family endonuclease
MHATLDPSTIRPLRRVEYDKLVDEGVFANERVELLYGLVVRMTPIREPHANAVDRLLKILIFAFGDRARVRCQGSFAASEDSEPEPDVGVYPERDYLTAHPTDAWLIVEVSDSSLAHDRGVKEALYAEVGVPEYWIVNLVDRAIEVYRDPVKGKYTSKTVHARGDSVTMLRFPDVTVAVSDVIR